MFRRVSGSLPPDFEFPETLEGLGYFINDKDQIKQIADPSEDFDYFVSKNDRYNERHREAMNTCIRRVLSERLEALNLKTVRLPRGTSPTAPHIPILASHCAISDAERIIIIFNEAGQDLGVWAYRDIGDSKRGNLSFGTAINLVEEIASRHASRRSACQRRTPPYLIIANPGQLVWHRAGKKAMTMPTWFALQRQSAVHDAMRLDEVFNSVEGHRTCKEHVASVFAMIEKLFAEENIEVQVIGISDGATAAVNYLNANWEYWNSRITALALCCPTHTHLDLTNDSFAGFMQARGRAYLLSDLPAGMPIYGTEETELSDSVHGHYREYSDEVHGGSGIYGCNSYSGGEEQYTESVLPRCYHDILDYFDEVFSDPTFVNPEIMVFDGKDDEEDVEWEAVMQEEGKSEVAEERKFVEVDEGID
ncbi:MAG: hypothetical protein M1819_007483 [Sarea resinae]|nr:MAG: hypothetical protein M1819_007483 [Sarea resinae]